MKFSLFPKRLSLRLKFALPFVAIASLPLLAITVITVQNLQELQREQTTNFSRLAAQEAAEEIGGFIELQLEVLKNIGTVHPEFAATPEIRDILLERFLHRSGSFLDIALLDQNGKEIARKNLVEVITPQDLRDLSETQEFQTTAKNGSYVGPFMLVKGKPLFFLGREIRGVDGEFRGAVIAQVDARTLQDVVTKKSLQTKDIRTYIVTEQGTVIAHPDISEVLAERDFSFFGPAHEFKSTRGIQDITQTYTNELGQSVLGTGVLFNKNQRFSMADLWLIIVEEQTSTALAPVKEITQFSFFVLVAVLFLSVLGAFLFANSLSKPIHELQKGARQIGLGNLDYSFRIHTNDEIEELAIELDKMRLRLKEVRAREENLSKLKSEFVSIVAHQLRTPLSALKWAIALFQEAKPKMSKDQKELIQKMRISNERMIRLVNDLLDAARIEEGRFVYKRTQVNFEDIINNTIKTLEHSSAIKNISISFPQPKEPLPSLFIDKEAMSLVLQNLAENAIRYTMPDGKVTIYASRSGANALLVSVEDTGIGITEKEKTRIFSKFFRGTKAVRLETEGSGLGLFIVKNIVEAHGGKVWFESQEKKGTTFHFTIPFEAHKRAH